MPIPIALAAAAIAAPVVGGIVGHVASRGDREAARAAAAQAYQEALSLGLPPDLSREIVFQEFKKAGIYSPEMEQAIDAGISEASQVQEDPALRDQQKGALELLAQRGRTGLGPEDRAALNQIRSEVQRDAEAKRQQIIQNFQQRGMGGAGAEIAAQLVQAQSDANRASEEGDRIASQASSRALEALLQGGQMAGQLRGQDFDVASAKARAADEMKRFNTENQIAREQRNVLSRNQAQQMNLSEAQRLQDTNTAQTNQERLRQRQAQRDYWQDQMQRTQLRSNAALGQASNLQQQAGQTAQMWQGIGSGVGAGAGAFANAYASQKATPSQPSGGDVSAQDDRTMPNNRRPYMMP